RSSLTCPYAAPQVASASALISASANVLTIARSRSGPACSQVIARQPGKVHTGHVGHRALPFLRRVGSSVRRISTVAVSAHGNTPRGSRSVHHSRGRERPLLAEGDLVGLNDTSHLPAVGKGQSRWMHTHPTGHGGAPDLPDCGSL